MWGASVRVRLLRNIHLTKYETDQLSLGLIWTSINFNPQCLTQLEHRSHLVIIFFSRLQHWTPHLWKLSACRSNTMKVAKTPTIVCQWTLTKHAQDISCTSIIIIGAICLIRRIIRVLSSRNRECHVLDLRYIVFNIINSKWLMICSREMYIWSLSTYKYLSFAE